ncbi:MAG: PDZ domain-containing protein, partial [Zoogloeaceae bacterium]|nr:PDZ domain-containing protein [Zoogloeaceae bacterium]
MPAYTLCPRDPLTRRFSLTCRVETPDAAGQCFSLPAWIPGSYLIRDFARHIVEIRAESEGRPVRLEKLDKSTWQAAPTAKPLTLHYEIHAGELSVRAAYLDRNFAFFNASSVFLYPHGQENKPCQVELLPPETGRAGWEVATSLPRRGARRNHGGFGLYRAKDYAELLDHPVLLGRLAEIPFTALGIQHRIILTGTTDYNRERLACDFGKICASQMTLFGKPQITEPYTFLVLLTDSGHGGLEHRNSSVLLAGHDGLPPAHLPENIAAPEAYGNFLSLASHEYFHRWNVKRIRPEALAQNEWQHENYTRLLWFFEGVTSYYDTLCLVRAGLITESDYLSRLGRTMTQVRQTPGRHWQSLADASFDAWIKYYRPDENSPNAQISYYSKGALLALWLDLELRLKSLGKISLDDLMRVLWQEYGAEERTLAEEEIFRLVLRLGGTDTARMLKTLVEGTGDLPLEQSLARVGVRLNWRAAEKTLWLGIRATTEQGKTRITHVLAGSPAEQAGLIAGDTLLALAGREVGSSLPAILARMQAGKTVSCHYFRGG